MRKMRDMDGMVNLAGLRFRVAQAAMAELLEKEAGLNRNLFQLTHSKSDMAQAARRSDDAALIAGADIRWHHWVDQRRAAINAELAQIRVAKENHMAAVKLAFGRDQTTKALRDKVAETARQTARRRADYES